MRTFLFPFSVNIYCRAHDSIYAFPHSLTHSLSLSLDSPDPYHTRFDGPRPTNPFREHQRHQVFDKGQQKEKSVRSESRLCLRMNEVTESTYHRQQLLVVKESTYHREPLYLSSPGETCQKRRKQVLKRSQQPVSHNLSLFSLYTHTHT